MILKPGDIAIDYSFARPTPAMIVAANVRCVCRYISPNRTNKKNLTTAERDALLAAGLSILLVWENSTTDPLQGIKFGQTHGLLAGEYARLLGYPPQFPIIIAVDFDTQLAQVETILDYCQAFKAACGYPVGVYGEADIVSTAALRGISVFGWQTVAWSHKVISPHAHCLQHATPVHPAVPLLGAVDDNTVLQSFKAWSTVPDPPDPPPNPQPEDDMEAITFEVTDLPGIYLWAPGMPAPVPFDLPDSFTSISTAMGAVHTDKPITQEMYHRLFVAPTIDVDAFAAKVAALITVPPLTGHIVADLGDKGHITGSVG